jgi:hypothetical protein
VTASAIANGDDTAFVDLSTPPRTLADALAIERHGHRHVEFVDGIPVLIEGPPRFPIPPSRIVR